MKKLLATFVILSALALQGCVVGVSSVQPPQARYYGHPALVVIPGTYVYAMTDVEDDIYFHVGWWWRLWDGRWYKSRYYDRGWVHYSGVPGFYLEVDPGWREFYRHRRWHGHPWDCERIPAPRVQSDWHRWQDTRHWEKERNWGVRGFRPEPYRHAGPAAQERDGSRFREADRHQQPRFDASQHRTVPMPTHGREFSRERNDSRTGREFFDSRRAYDRNPDTRGGDRYNGHQQSRRQSIIENSRRDEGQAAPRISERLQQDRRQTPQLFEQQRRDEGEVKDRRGRRDGEELDSRRNRKPFEFRRQESGEVSRPEREQFRERPENLNRNPLTEQRRPEPRPEQVQRHEGPGSQEAQFEPRRKEVGQEQPLDQKRNRDARNRRRPAQGLPAQEPGEARVSAEDSPGFSPAQ